MKPDRLTVPAADPTASPAVIKPRSQPLFTDTVTVSKVRSPEGNGLLAGVTDDKALRVVHRGHTIKVVVTEERYLELLTFWQLYQHHHQPMPATTAAVELAAAEREDAELDALEAADRD